VITFEDMVVVIVVKSFNVRSLSRFKAIQGSLFVRRQSVGTMFDSNK
jgi:hypothetical protein